eukprot:2769873-Pyramimonas_sp.AAC.1
MNSGSGGAPLDCLWLGNSHPSWRIRTPAGESAPQLANPHPSWRVYAHSPALSPPQESLRVEHRRILREAEAEVAK